MDSIEATRELVKLGDYDKYTGQIRLYHDRVELGISEKQWDALRVLMGGNHNYVLVLVDYDDDKPDYVLCPTKGYIIEPLNECTDFVKSYYRKYNVEFETRVATYKYFESNNLSYAIDMALLNGIYLENWVNGYEPVLSMDKESNSFVWCEIHNFA